jgi:hypothetical protein
MNTENVRGIPVGIIAWQDIIFATCFQGRIQDFKLGGAHLKFVWGYFVWKIYAPSSKNVLDETCACGFYAKKSSFLNLGEGGAAGAPPPPRFTPGFPRYYIVMRAERPISMRYFKMC